MGFFIPQDGYGVFRWGDVEPSGLATELRYAKKMLQEGDVEGEVRDAKGNVVYVHRPKKPLAERIEAAKGRLRRAELAQVLAESELRGSKHSLERLLKLEQVRAEQTQDTEQSASLPLFAGKVV